MKNNNLLIALTICGLVAITTFAMQQKGQTKSSTWSEWFSPTAWYQSVKNKAQQAASSTFDMVNAIKNGVGLEDVTYRTLGAAVAALVVLGYNQEMVQKLVAGIYNTLQPVASGIVKTTASVVSHKVVATPLAVAAGVATLNAMDKAAVEKKQKTNNQ